MFVHIILSSVWVAERAAHLVGHMISLFFLLFVIFVISHFWLA